MSELTIAQEQLFFSKYNYDTQLQICKSLQSTHDDFKLLSIYRNEWRDLSKKIQEIKKQEKLKIQEIKKQEKLKNQLCIIQNQ